MRLTTALLLTTLCIPAAQATAQTTTTVPAAPADAQPATVQPATVQPAAPAVARSLDARHRIEIRAGGWANGWYDEPVGWQASGSAQGAFGLEYLSFVRDDLGIGIALTSLGSAEGDWGATHDSGTARLISSIPVVARWYPARRLTQTRSVEPYLTAGIGPVFGVDTAYLDGGWKYDWHANAPTSTHVATTVGGRVGGGVDFRLGSVFTLGLSGAWNWDAGFPDDLWRGARPNGGEFTVVMGWNFGR